MMLQKDEIHAFIIERVEAMKAGKTDAREIIRTECTTSARDFDLDSILGRFYERKYREWCRELGIER
jgi:hypothetical protein